MSEQSLEQTLLYEAIDSIYQQINTRIKTFWFAFALFLALTWGAFELYKISIILFLFIVMYFIRHKAVTAFQNDQQALQNIEHWKKIILFISAGSGITLGLVAFLFYPLHNPNYQIAYFIMMIGVVSGSASVYERYEPLYRLTILPVYIGIMSNFILLGTLFHLAMAFGISVFFVFMHKMVKNHYLIFRQFSTAQYRNKQLIKRLETQKQTLEQVNQEKAYFIASANHDIRQPIHALNLFIEALYKQDLPHQSQGIVRNMKKSLFVLKNYLLSLLDIARLDADTIKVQKIPINLKTLLAEIHINHIELANENNITFKYKAIDAQVHLDINIINTALGHVLTNAFKFARNKKVLLTAKIMQQHLCLRVYDTGCGIVPSEINTIFDDFKQLDHLNQTAKQGLGLGLTISKKMLALISGKIQVQSTLNQGSCFSIFIPLTEVQPNRITPPIPRLVQSTALQDKTILLIDDDKTILNAMSCALETYCQKIYSATDFNSATTTLNGLTPDIIISDYRLEHENGIQLIEKLRQFYGTNIKALIITADTYGKIQHPLINKSIRVYHKPLQIDQLLLALNNALEH